MHESQSKNSVPQLTRYKQFCSGEILKASEKAAPILLRGPIKMVEVLLAMNDNFLCLVI